MSSAWAIGFGVSPMLQECKGKKKGLSESEPTAVIR